MTGVLSSPDGAEMRIAADIDQVPQPVSMPHIAAISIPEIPGLRISGQARMSGWI